MNTYYFQMSVKSVDTADKETIRVSGFASTPDVDRYDEIVEPEAFRKALGLYMQNPVVLRSHNADRPIGNVVSALVTEKGLKVEAEIKDPQTIEEIKDGRMRAFSIGYRPLSVKLQHRDGSDFDPEKDSIFDDDIVRVIKELDLVEISVVATPANGYALFTIQKSINKALNEIVMKSFDLKDAPEEEKETREETEEVAEELETTEEAGEVEETEEETEKSVKQDAENEGETPSPEAEVSDETSVDEEATEAEAEKLYITAKDASNLRILTAVGVVEIKDNAKALPKEYKEVLELADKALDLARKHIEELEAKLDNVAVKQPLAYRAEQNTASKSFLSLFGLN